MTTKIIPDIYTTYEDGHIGALSASLSNVEAKIGPAASGLPGHVYGFSGASGKADAKLVFQSGALLDAICQAFDAGSSLIYAVRTNGGTASTLALKDVTGADCMTLVSGYSEAANDYYATLNTTFSVTSQTKINFDATAETLTFGDRTQAYPDPIRTVYTVCALGRDEQLAGKRGLYVFGAEGFATAVPKIWRLTDQLLVDKTFTPVVITSAVPTTGLVGFCCSSGHSQYFLFATASTLYVSTNTHQAPISKSFNDTCTGMALYDNTTLGPFASDPLFLVAFTFASKDASYLTLNLVGVGSDGTNTTLTNELQYSCSLPKAPVGLVQEYTTSQQGTNNHRLYVGMDNGSGVAFYIIDPHMPVPQSLSYLQSVPVTFCDLAILSADVSETLTIVNGKDSSDTTTITVKGDLANTTAALLDAVNATSFSAVLEDATATPLVLAGTAAGSFSGGHNTRYAYGPSEATVFETALVQLESNTDICWVQPVGFDDSNWKSIVDKLIAHCTKMREELKAERFAILGMPLFPYTGQTGTSDYITAMGDYMQTLTDCANYVADRDLVLFAGGARLAGADDIVRVYSVAAACGGVMASLDVQKSLINKTVTGAQSLVPAFSPDQLATLIRNRVNPLMFKPGRGIVIAHSLTAAPKGSDYSRVNDLRAVYYASRAAREAGAIYIGEENDAKGEGLRRLESAMSRPLQRMKDAGQIDDFELTVVSPEAARLLGEVYVTLAITPRRAMEIIYVTVYLQ